MGFDQRLAEVRTGFERSFWVANVSELFERLSYYAAFASLAPAQHQHIVTLLYACKCHMLLKAPPAPGR